jgi:hypothetical protein
MRITSEDAAILSFCAKVISLNRKDVAIKYLDKLEGNATIVLEDMLAECKSPISKAYMDWARKPPSLDQMFKRG